MVGVHIVVGVAVGLPEWCNLPNKKKRDAAAQICWMCILGSAKRGMEAHLLPQQEPVGTCG